MKRERNMVCGKAILAAAVAVAAGLTITGSARAQANLFGTQYLQDFNGINAGLPTGWTVNTGASIVDNGTAGAFSTTKIAWADSAGAFKNFASSNDLTLTATSTTAQQAASTDRALGIRPTAAVGDGGAAFVFQIANTTGITFSSLALDLEMLSVQTRSTTYTIDYRVGSSGAFTALDTYPDPGVFGTTHKTIDLSAITALNNQSQPVFFRVVSLSPSAGSGSRDSIGIDNFTLNYTGGASQQTPRDLVWDPAASAAGGTNGDGTWNTTNGNWYSAGTGAVTWDNTRPDNATFGTGSGTGTATVTLGEAMTAGSITFAANSPTYTLNGATLTLSGSSGTGLVVNQSATINNTINVNGPQTWSVASGAVLDLAGLTGGGLVTKTGAGTIIADTPSPTFLGGMTINGGTVRVTAIDGNNATGLGTGTVTVGNGATLAIEGVDVGTTQTQSAPLIQLDNGSTLIASGTSSYNRSSAALTIVNGTSAAPKTVDIKTVNASDVFTIGNAPKQSVGGGETYSTIRVSGPGRVVLSSGGTTSNTTFAGSWELDSGILQIGPIPPGAFGEQLNALGFKNGDASQANAITIKGGVFAVAVNAPNTTQNQVPPPPSYIRNPVTLDGGAIASSTLDANFGGPLTTTAGKTSKVLVYDPVGTPVTRNVHLQASADTSLAGTLVIDPGTTTGGTFYVERAGGTSTVAAGTQVQVLAGAALNLGGTQDTFNDTTSGNAVAIANAGTFSATAGSKTVGAITGTGTTNVSGGTTLVIKAGSATSIQSAVNIDGSSLLDLNNNKLAIDYTGSTVADAVRGQLQSGRGSGAWDGTTGITTSSGKPASDANQVTAIGYAEASQVVGAGGGTWAGVGVDGSALLLKYTYYGDANLDGKIDGSDYTLLDKGFNSHVSNAHWTDGDFNYDGQVNSDDYMLADVAFGHQSGGVLSPDFLAQREIQFGEAYVTSLVAAVPEPTSLGLVGVAAAGLLGRRRRSAK